MPRAGGLGRARIDRDNLVPAADDLDQRRHREVGRAHEHEAQRHLTPPRRRASRHRRRRSSRSPSVSRITTEAGIVRPRFDCRNLHECKPALRPRQHGLRLHGRGIPGRDDRIQPILVVDAVPFEGCARRPRASRTDRRSARRMCSRTESPSRNSRIRMSTSVSSTPRVPLDLAPHIAEPMLAMLLGLAGRRHRLRAIDEAIQGPRIPRHGDAGVRMKADAQPCPTPPDRG